MKPKFIPREKAINILMDYGVPESKATQFLRESRPKIPEINFIGEKKAIIGEKTFYKLKGEAEVKPLKVEGIKTKGFKPYKTKVDAVAYSRNLMGLNALQYVQKVSGKYSDRYFPNVFF